MFWERPTSWHASIASWRASRACQSNVCLVQSELIHEVLLCFAYFDIIPLAFCAYRHAAKERKC